MISFFLSAQFDIYCRGGACPSRLVLYKFRGKGKHLPYGTKCIFIKILISLLARGRQEKFCTHYPDLPAEVLRKQNGQPFRLSVSVCLIFHQGSTSYKVLKRNRPAPHTDNKPSAVSRPQAQLLRDSQGRHFCRSAVQFRRRRFFRRQG